MSEEPFNEEEREEWEINEIKSGIGEAEAGDFANEQEIKMLDKKWGYYRK